MGNTKDGIWKWDLAWRRSMFEWEADNAKELNVMIKDTRISPGIPNKWLWTHNKDGQYSTKSAYSLLIKDHGGSSGASTFKRVWNPILPNKILAFNWQVLLDRIPTKLNLLKRGCAKWWEDSKCVMCEAEEEDSDHLFLKCRLVKWLWKACAAWWGINVRLDNNCWDTFEKLGEGNKDSRIREGWDCIWNAMVWSMWLARNQKIFQQSEQKKEKLLELIQLRAFLWIKARKPDSALLLLLPTLNKKTQADPHLPLEKKGISGSALLYPSVGCSSLLGVSSSKFLIAAGLPPNCSSSFAGILVLLWLRALGLSLRYYGFEVLWYQIVA
ncbi:hypothetical protein SLEP1_g6623 [Rubroshorea leprosula]|uniref:Reverse transcriptase zinc-binding domain-containing protein n=1 Tax=Rubroshorea leprosula TaxID=152421 RepID=A0AAV5I3W6_9ROSI|nr:hypothetical protein SLEP1_g6623 [Rubroshorea leprosula]